MLRAARADQKSWIGTGTLTIFTQALVDGFSGKGYVANVGGYVSVFDLYRHTYAEAKRGAQKLGKQQEPELSILRAVGPFPVALYRGATDLGKFDDGAPVPEDGAVREVDPEFSKAMFKQIINIHVTASGSHSVAAGRDVNYFNGNPPR